jgi:hypothetical protein
VWDGLALDMSTLAKRRWQSFSPDDRAVLGYALRDAIARPYLVGSYQLGFRRRRSTGDIVQVHTFRFGFANFVIETTPTTLMVCDLWLDDERALAAE